MSFKIITNAGSKIKHNAWGALEFILGLAFLFIIYSLFSQRSVQGVLMKGYIRDNQFYVSDLNGGYQPVQRQGDQLYLRGKYVGTVVSNADYE